MRVTYVAAGAGVAYCGACIRDLTLVDGLRRRGHEVDLLGLYTPLKGDAIGVAETARVFYGGINVFLQQTAGFFQHTPWSVDWFLDRPALLRLASRLALETVPEALGPMTVSVLAGREGRQRKELEKLTAHLRRGPRPDVVTITNSLLSAIAPEVKRRLDVPVACSFQGEDSFLARLPEPHRSEALRRARENSRAVDLFISPSEAHGRKMAGLLGIPAAKLRVVRVGIDMTAFGPAAARARQPFVIGYLSVIAPQKGLDLLVGAFDLLVNAQRRDAVLRVAGRPVAPAYWRAVKRRLSERGLLRRFEHREELDLAGKADFLRGCSVFCVPSRLEESRGTAVMEAMATGLPVVAPATGVFPELVGATGAGTLVPPGEVEPLARALARTMDEPEKADATGRAALERIAARHTLLETLDEMESVLRELVRRGPGRSELVVPSR